MLETESAGKALRTDVGRHSHLLRCMKMVRESARHDLKRSGTSREAPQHRRPHVLVSLYVPVEGRHSSRDPLLHPPRGRPPRRKPQSDEAGAALADCIRLVGTGGRKRSQQCARYASARCFCAAMATASRCRTVCIVAPRQGSICSQTRLARRASPHDDGGKQRHASSGDRVAQRPTISAHALKALLRLFLRRADPTGGAESVREPAACSRAAGNRAGLGTVREV